MSNQKKIVVVEDDSVTRKYLNSTLIKLNYDVVASFESGEDAIPFILKNESKIDLLLVDIELKGEKRGIDIVREINRVIELPVILITSLIDKKTLSEAKDVFPAEYLLKPVGSDELYTSIEIIYNNFINNKKVRENERNLNERIKELNCLYEISKITEDQNKSIEIILSETVEVLPPSLLFSEIASAVIEYNGVTYKNSNYRDVVKFIKEDITCNNKKIGFVKFGYSEYVKIPQLDSSFLLEEVLLIKEISRRIERIIERILAQNELQKIEKEVVNISERERKRIGHDLHDGLGQLLTGISFLVKSFINRMPKDSKMLTGKIIEVDELVKEAVETCSDISKGLTPSNFIQGNLINSIEVFAKRVTNIFDLSCTFETDFVEIYDDFVALQLFRITQEAVNNAVKYAEAKKINISLMTDGNVIQMSIKDDGIGISDDAKGNGMGLNIMKYRSNLINGSFIAENHENGFIVTVDFEV